MATDTYIHVSPNAVEPDVVQPPILIGTALVTPTGGTQTALASLLNGGTVAQTITLATGSAIATGATVTNNGTLNGGVVIALGSAGNALTTTGSTQAGALALTAEFNNLSTVAANTGATLPASAAGELSITANTGTNTATIYALGTVDTINGVAGTIGMPLPPNTILLSMSTAAGAIEAGVHNPVQSGYIANTVSASATLVAGNVFIGEAFTALDMTGSLSATGTLTLPSVAALQAAIPAPTSTTSWLWRILNHSASANSWTLGATTGYTLSGTLTVAQSTFRDFAVKFTSNSAVTIQDVGGGTIV